MEPKRERTADDPTPATSAQINITFNGHESWTFDPEAVYMAYDAPGTPADQITFNFTDNSGHEYRIVRLKFTDAQGNSIPAIMDDWKADSYDEGVTSITIADNNRNQSSADMQINYCVKIKAKDGKHKWSDPKIWDVKGGG